MKTFNEFQSAVITLATGWGIFKHANRQLQAHYVIAEYGELTEAILKNDLNKIKDAIGDVAVTLINCAHFDNVKIDYAKARAIGGEYDTYKLLREFHKLSGCLLCTDNEIPSNAYHTLLFFIIKLADFHGVDFKQCCFEVYDIISKRTGKTTNDGVFVKDE